jgi:hypothetical protein
VDQQAARAEQDGNLWGTGVEIFGVPWFFGAVHALLLVLLSDLSNW